jgi:hypothetical protein
MTNQNTAFHLPADSGPCYWGPGDRYTFLVNVLIARMVGAGPKHGMEFV